MATASSQIWGSAAWWFVLVISLPFAVHVWPFAINGFETYSERTLNFAAKNFDVAGLQVRHRRVTGQTHCIMALAYTFMGPFQFAPRLRRAYPVIHRRMGYASWGAAMVQCVTGMALMNPCARFGTIQRTAFFVAGFGFFTSTCVGVFAARQKQFELHQRWMIRAAAIGYAAIGVRLWISSLVAAGMYFKYAAELGAVLAPISFALPAEFYIRTCLDDDKKKA